MDNDDIWSVQNMIIRPPQKDETKGVPWRRNAVETLDEGVKESQEIMDKMYQEAQITLERAEKKLKEQLDVRSKQEEEHINALRDKVTKDSVILENMNGYYSPRFSQRVLFYSGGRSGISKGGDDKHEYSTRLLRDVGRFDSELESIHVVVAEDEEPWGVGEAFNLIMVEQDPQERDGERFKWVAAVRISNAKVYDDVHIHYHHAVNSLAPQPPLPNYP